MTKKTRWQGFALVGVCVLISAACVPASSSTEASARDELIDTADVTQIVVRYEQGAPPTTSEGRPWGSQCVSTAHRQKLFVDRGIGARMRVVRIQPPTSAFLARAIAAQIGQCPLIEWAEADTVTLTLG